MKATPFRPIVVSFLLVLALLIAQPIQPAYAAWLPDCTAVAGDLTALGFSEDAAGQAQCDSLLSIYVNLGGDTWIDGAQGSGADAWGEVTHVSNWFGVIHSNPGGVGDVNAIGLFSNDLIGNINAVDLTGLTELVLLGLSDNQIGGNIDGLNLTGLTNLEVLYLYDNLIGGSIDGLNLQGVGGVGAPTALYDIDLSENQIGGSINGLNLTGLTNLEYLYLYDNQIGGSIDGFDLTDQTALIELILAENLIGGNIAGFNLTGLAALELLVLEDNQIGGSIDGFDLTDQTSLIELYLAENLIGGDIGGFDVQIQNSPLEILDAAYNQIGGNIEDFDLTGNPELYVIALDHNQIGGNIDGFILPAPCPNLFWLDLEDNQIGGDIGGFDVRIQACPLEYLDIDDNQIGGNIEDFDLTGSPELFELDANFNQIGGDIGLVNLGANVNLEILELGNNQIGGDPSTIAGIPASLEILLLGTNQMSGTVPDLTGTLISPGDLTLCYNPSVAPSGTAAIDSFAETNDATGWTVAGGGCSLPVVGGGGGGGAAQVAADCNVTIDVEADREVVNWGDRVVWTVLIRNPGPDECQGVYTYGTMPGEFSITDISPSRGSLTWDGGQYYRVDLGTLVVGDQVTVSIDSLLQGGAAFTLPEGAAGQSAGQQICLTGYITDPVNDTDCVTLFPDSLPATGGEPVNQSPIWVWVTIAMMLIAGLGGYAIRRRMA